MWAGSVAPLILNILNHMLLLRGRMVDIWSALSIVYRFTLTRKCQYLMKTLLKKFLRNHSYATISYLKYVVKRLKHFDYMQWIMNLKRQKGRQQAASPTAWVMTHTRPLHSSRPPLTITPSSLPPSLECAISSASGRMVRQFLFRSTSKSAPVVEDEVHHACASRGLGLNGHL